MSRHCVFRAFRPLLGILAVLVLQFLVTSVQAGQEDSQVSHAGAEVTLNLPDEVTAANAPPVDDVAAPPLACGRHIIFFGTDDAELDDRARSTLDAAIGACPFAEIVLAGSTDAAGPPAYNVMLSQRRADAASMFLQTRGVSENQIRTEAYGESRPLVDTADGTAEPQNRHVSVSMEPRLPAFPLPAPSPSDHYTIPRNAFRAATTLEHVNRLLRRTLDAAAYKQPRYLAVRDGFALVVQMERREDDGASWRIPSERWNLGPVSLLPANTDWTTRLLAPFASGPAHAGRYRIFVFLVTTADVRTNRPAPSEIQAQAWLESGAIRLPETIGSIPYSAQHDVVALIYDFERRAVGSRMVPLNPTPIPAQVHLQKASILR